jgi:hypothetical protein
MAYTWRICGQPPKELTCVSRGNRSQDHVSSAPRFSRFTRVPAADVGSFFRPVIALRENDRLGEIWRVPGRRRQPAGPAGSQGIFRTASIRSAVPGWVAKNPPLPGPETCRSQVKVSIIISFG